MKITENAMKAMADALKKKPSEPFKQAKPELDKEPTQANVGAG